MSAEILALLKRLTPNHVKLHIWPNGAGYQVNISSHDDNSWTCEINIDLETALLRALEGRLLPRGGATPPPPPPAVAADSEEKDLIG